MKIVTWNVNLYIISLRGGRDILEKILECFQTIVINKPDYIFIQESSEQLIQELPKRIKYDLLISKLTHMGYIAIFANKESTAESIYSTKNTVGMTVDDIVFRNCHFPIFSNERKTEIYRSGDCDVLIGDTNFDRNEMPDYHDLGTRDTWSNEYFGHNPIEKRRPDRCLIHPSYNITTFRELVIPTTFSDHYIVEFMFQIDKCIPS